MAKKTKKLAAKKSARKKTTTKKAPAKKPVAKKPAIDWVAVLRSGADGVKKWNKLTRRAQMDPGLVRRLGLFDYLRERLAVAGTPAECVAQVRRALAAGARQLMFTVSLAADPVRTVELFGREVLPRLRG